MKEACRLDFLSVILTPIWKILNRISPFYGRSKEAYA